MPTNTLRQLRVILVGGTGFIGPHVAERLSHLGHSVTVYHRGDHEPRLPFGVRHVHSPLAARPVVGFPEELTALASDVVVAMHLVGERDARALADAFRGVARRVVALSSGDVYRAYGLVRGTETGLPDRSPLTEESALRTKLYPYRGGRPGPYDPETYEKILAEREIARHAELPATVLRLPVVYGPGDDQHRFFATLKRFDDRRRAFLLEERLAAWRWTHGYVENVAHAIVLAVGREEAAGKTYNVGEHSTPSVAERVGRIAVAAGWRGTIVTQEASKLPPYLVVPLHFEQEIVYDTSRIRRELGYEEPISEAEALRRTIEWERANPPAHVDPAQFDYAAEDRALRNAGFGTGD
ncbi:MAG TPA: NAD-dependent epimerase/dehydratase family protein [Thermoanaerobaculia bacterium]